MRISSQLVVYGAAIAMSADIRSGLAAIGWACISNVSIRVTPCILGYVTGSLVCGGLCQSDFPDVFSLTIYWHLICASGHAGH